MSGGFLLRGPVPADIQKGMDELDAANRVDDRAGSGDQAFVFRMVSDPEPQEADGATRTRQMLTSMSNPSIVDTQLAMSFICRSVPGCLDE